MKNSSNEYELRFEARTGYLYATLRAKTMTRDIPPAYLEEVPNECKRLDCKRLLIERDVPVMLTDSDLFLVTNSFLEMMKNRRVAFVNTYATIEADMKFAITFGTNRGANYKLFDDLDAAEKWLML